MALNAETENAILKKLLKTVLVSREISIPELPERIANAARHIGEKPEDVLEITGPLLKEAIDEALNPERLKEIREDGHSHNTFNFWHGGH